MKVRKDINANIDKRVLDFYNRSLSVANHRYRSWEHCFKHFKELRTKKDIHVEDIYLASLNLAFYLASWGMYRGSCFILQYDYHIHDDVVTEILKDDYNILQCIDFDNAKVEGTEIKRLNQLINSLGQIYKRLDGKMAQKASDTLITKIVLGTFACSPAYDSYVKEGMRCIKLHVSENLSKNVNTVIDFYKKNAAELKMVQSSVSQNGFSYPIMKIVDMYFWEIGNEIARIDKEEERQLKKVEKSEKPTEKR